MFLLALTLSASLCPGGANVVHPGNLELRRIVSSGETGRWWKANERRVSELQRSIFGSASRNTIVGVSDSPQYCRDGSANLFTAEQERKFLVGLCPGMLALLSQLEVSDWEPILKLLFAHEMRHVIAFRNREAIDEGEADRYAAERLFSLGANEQELSHGLRFLCGYPSSGEYPSGSDRINSIADAWTRARNAKNAKASSPEAPRPHSPIEAKHSGYPGPT